MATKRIKDISTTATTFAADDFIALDASSVGTRKMAKASLITQVGANYLEKADNLSDVASKDTSKLNLEVPNVGTAANEVSVNGMLGDLAFQSSAGVVVGDLTVDGQLTAAVGKPMPVNGPSMRFDGVDDYVDFADNNAFSFTNGTDDTPFTVSAWVKCEDWSTNAHVLAKYGSSSPSREYLFGGDGSGNLRLIVLDAAGIDSFVTSNASLTGYNGQYIHVAASYSGAGPNSSNAFSAAMSGAKLFVNGAEVASTSTNDPAYAGMSDSSQAVWIGRASGVYISGQIRDAQIFNKELSLAEVREVYSNGQLPNSFLESTGAIAYASDFSAGVDGWFVNGNGTGNVDGINAQNDWLQIDRTGLGVGSLYTRKSVPISNKRYRGTARVFVPAGANANGVDYIQFYVNNASGTQPSPVSVSDGTEYVISAEWEATLSTNYGVRVSNSAGTALDSTLADGTTIYIKDIKVTQIGSVLDARAEQFDTSTGKLYDLSGNGFVGTQSGGVSLLGKKFLVYETGTWTPTITFGGGSTGVTYTAADGYYTRVGDICFVRGAMILSSKGSDTGMWKINNLPYDSTSAGINSSFAQVYLTTAAGLTSLPFGLVDDGGNGITLFDNGATGATVLTDANAQNTTTIRFSGTYQIQ